MKSITVFCGSSTGNNDIFKEQAYEVGKTLAERNIRLVFGGGKVGLMGAVSEGALDHGGEAIGVLPIFLKRKELEHENLTEMIIVDSMHERKMKMYELCDGVITLPGGFGTMEEFFEMVTWAQLGLHQKPIALLNTDGYYDDLLSLMENMVRKGFLQEQYKNMLLHDDEIEMLLDKMNKYKAPDVGKWMSKTAT